MRLTESRLKWSRAWRPTTTCESTGRLSKPSRRSTQLVSRGTTEAAAVFSTGPLDALKQEYHHGNEFLGYSGTEAEARVIGIIEQNRLAESAQAGEGTSLVVILDRTPFYGESGGQVGDTGTIKGERFSFEVQDTKKENDFILHVGRVVEGTVTVNDRVQAVVEGARRQAIRRAHTCNPSAASCTPRNPGQTRAAGGQQGRARSAAIRLRQSRGCRPRAATRDRRRRE